MKSLLLAFTLLTSSLAFGQSMLVMNIKNHNYCFTHYPLGFDDGYNRQHEDGSYSIQDRMDYSFQLASDFDVQTVVHGHLHSKIATGPLFDYINVSAEHTDFKPIRLRDII